MRKIKEIVFVGCLCFFMLSYVHAQQKTGWVTLKGQLKNFSNQVEIEDFSEFQYLLPSSSERIFVPDAEGNFNIKFKVSAPNYYRLGRNSLYLSSGDNLEVFIDNDDPGLATFKGRGAEANRYMKNTPFPKSGSFIYGGKYVMSTPELTIASVEKQAVLRSKELAKVTNVSAEFRRLETARIKADLINSIKSGEVYGIYTLKLKDQEGRAYIDKYKKVSMPKILEYGKNFIDPSLMKQVVYRDIAYDLIKQGGKPAAIQQIKDWYAASNLVDQMQKVSDKNELSAFKVKIAELKTIAYKDAANKMLHQLMAFGKGDTAIDFTAVDLNGKTVSLSTLKGKVIYVDLWATWCGPCMQEMPFYEKLKLQYKDNPEVVFVSLSIDSEVALWKKSVEERETDGYQWRINRAELKDYNIVGIPRSLLIDKGFKIVDMNAPMPSKEGAAKAIDELLKQ